MILGCKKEANLLYFMTIETRAKKIDFEVWLNETHPHITLHPEVGSIRIKFGNKEQAVVFEEKYLND